MLLSVSRVDDILNATQKLLPTAQCATLDRIIPMDHHWSHHGLSEKQKKWVITWLINGELSSDNPVINGG